MILSLIPPKIIPREFFDRFEKLIGEKILSLPGSGEAADNKLLDQVDILIIFGRMGREALINYPALKWVFSISAGVEKIPFEELKSKGVIVSNTRGIHGEQMAEHVIGFILSFSRQLAVARDNQRLRKWFQALPVYELPEKKLLIIGAGSIGREIARKASVFDMNITGIRKNPENLDNFNSIAGPDLLYEKLGEADFVVLVTPLTDETYHIMGAAEFKAMKKESYFINISRGDTVDETALIEALRAGTIAGAALDVFHTEPLPANSPLWGMENVIITPHNSGISPLYMDKTFEIFRKSLSLFREGKLPLNIIDLDRKY